MHGPTLPLRLPVHPIPLIKLSVYAPKTELASFTTPLLLLPHHYFTSLRPPPAFPPSYPTFPTPEDKKYSVPLLPFYRRTAAGVQTGTGVIGSCEEVAVVWVIDGLIAEVECWESGVAEIECQ